MALEDDDGQKGKQLQHVEPDHARAGDVDAPLGAADPEEEDQGRDLDEGEHRVVEDLI